MELSPDLSDPGLQQGASIISKMFWVSYTCPRALHWILLQGAAAAKGDSRTVFSEQVLQEPATSDHTQQSCSTSTQHSFLNSDSTGMYTLKTCFIIAVNHYYENVWNSAYSYNNMHARFYAVYDTEKKYAGQTLLDPQTQFHGIFIIIMHYKYFILTVSIELPVHKHWSKCHPYSFSELYDCMTCYLHLDFWGLH